MKTSLHALLVGLLSLLVGAAHAQTAATTQVWRCGADGRSYSDQPCAGGATLAAIAGRPAGDLDAAAARVDRDLKLAQSLRQERLQREVPPPGSRTKKDKPAPKRKIKQPAADGTFRATAPASRPSPG